MRARSSRTYGREADLRLLVDVADGVRADRSSASVVVRGEAGVGKTRLVGDLVAALRERRDLVVLGHGVQLAVGEVPFGVLAETLRDLVRTIGADRVRTVLGADADALAALVPALRSGAAWAEPDHGRVLGATADLLEALTADGLVGWVVEDLQWADASTRDAFVYLARTLSSCPLLTVATWRDEDGAGDPPPLGPATEVVDLRPLADDDLAALVADVAPGLPLADRRRLAELSQGLPFLVEELASTWRRGAGLDPAYLRRLVLTRLPDLSPPARELVDLAAAGDGHLDVRLLEDGLGVDADAVREAVAAGILDADHGAGVLRFRHALLREAVEEAQAPGDRRRLHRRWAEAIEAAPDALGLGRVGALARHWDEAEDAERALPALVKAAEQAAALPSSQAEHTALRRALAWWDRVPDAEQRCGLSRPRVQFRAVAAAFAGADPESAHDVLVEERDRRTGGDPVGDAYVDLRLTLFEEDFRQREQTAVQHHIDRLLEGETTDPRVLDGLTFALAQGLEDPASEASVVERLQDGLARTSDADEIVLAAAALSALHYRRGDIETELEVVQAHRPRVAGAALAGQWMLATHEAYALTLLGRATEAPTLLEAELRRLSRPSALAGLFSDVAENLAEALIASGRWDEALAVSEEALRVTPHLFPEDPILLGADNVAMHMCALRAGRGELAAARTAADALLVHLGPRPWADRLPPVANIVATATVSAAEGDLTRCRSELAGAWDLSPIGSLGVELSRAVLVALRAESALVDRHEAAAAAASAAVVDRVVATASALPQPGARGAAWWAEAQAHAARSRRGDTAAGWALAVAAWRACRQPYDVAQCLRWQGEAHLVEGDPDAATAALAEAESLCSGLGARPLREAVLAVARRGRLGVGARAPAAGPLTARESEVLALLAVGRTNQQVADALFMSPKTVSVHVSHILAKLGAANRTEAVAEGRRRGLVD